MNEPDVAVVYTQAYSLLGQGRGDEGLELLFQCLERARSGEPFAQLAECLAKVGSFGNTIYILSLFLLPDSLLLNLKTTSLPPSLLQQLCTPGEGRGQQQAVSHRLGVLPGESG